MCYSAHRVLVIEKQFLQLASLQQLQDKAFLGQPEGRSCTFLQEVQYVVTRGQPEIKMKLKSNLSLPHHFGGVMAVFISIWDLQ